MRLYYKEEFVCYNLSILNYCFFCTISYSKSQVNLKYTVEINTAERLMTIYLDVMGGVPKTPSEGPGLDTGYFRAIIQ